MTQNGQDYYFIVLLRECLALFFLVAANTTSFNLSKIDTTDLKAQNKYIGTISQKNAD